MYRAVVSPSNVGLVAKITSLIFPLSNRLSNELILISFIPIPLAGFNDPPKI